MGLIVDCGTHYSESLGSDAEPWREVCNNHPLAVDSEKVEEGWVASFVKNCLDESGNMGASSGI